MKDFDPTKPLKHISYLGMNNLYGWEMSGYLPYDRFKGLKNIYNFDVNSISECTFIEKSQIGHILEVDLEYPDELHVLHNDYPVAPEKLAIPYDIMT